MPGYLVVQLEGMTRAASRWEACNTKSSRVTICQRIKSHIPVMQWSESCFGRKDMSVWIYVKVSPVKWACRQLTDDAHLPILDPTQNSRASIYEDFCTNLSSRSPSVLNMSILPARPVFRGWITLIAHQVSPSLYYHRGKKINNQRRHTRPNMKCTSARLSTCLIYCSPCAPR